MAGLLRELYRRLGSKDRPSPRECARHAAKLLTARGRAELRYRLGLAQAAAAPAVPWTEPQPRLVAPPLREVAGVRRLSAFVPALRLGLLSGGPNTALLVALRLAREAGVPLRVVATDLAVAPEATLREHLQALAPELASGVDVAFTSIVDRTRPLEVGTHEVLLASAWWTAWPVQRLLQASARPRPFLYLVQEYEPGLYAWSSEHALAAATHAMDMRPIVNERFVLEHLVAERAGRFADPEFVRRHCHTFEPALDRRLFHAEPPGEPRARGGKRRLLFYARPSAPRNLHDLGLLALRQAVEAGAFPAGDWELCRIGEVLPDQELARGQVLRQLPWSDFAGYARLLREADAGLSLMLSPHTSYPPLELAACGVPCVTTSWATKTAARLQALSANLIPVPPDPAAIAEGLREAEARSVDVARRRAGAAVALPRTWDEALTPIVPGVLAEMRAILG